MRFRILVVLLWIGRIGTAETFDLVSVGSVKWLETGELQIVSPTGPEKIPGPLIGVLGKKAEKIFAWGSSLTVLNVDRELWVHDIGRVVMPAQYITGSKEELDRLKSIDSLLGVYPNLLFVTSGNQVYIYEWTKGLKLIKSSEVKNLDSQSKIWKFYLENLKKTFNLTGDY